MTTTATTEHTFALPDVGEGLTEAEILRWHVRPGDVVEVNQPLVEIETAKAAVDLPSPFAGLVTGLLVEVGQIVPVGTGIITVEVVDAPAAAEQRSVLVGYGVRASRPPGRRARAATPASGAPAVRSERVLAKPPVRHLARELGVDLAEVRPTGTRGEVTRADVLGATRPDGAAPSIVPQAAVPGAQSLPVRGVQRAMADAMVSSAFSAPHVTEWLDLDMTRALEVLDALRARTAGSGVRVTSTVLVAAALVRAAREHPRANSTWEDRADGPHVVVHGRVHLGVAADTARGLVVPVVHDAADLGLLALARRVQEAVDAAREGRATPADLTGGTITLTNVGVFGVDGGTPILVPGQSVILAMGRIIERPWVVGGAVVARPVMQLSLSFDHRVVDGALGSRVLSSVAQFLADPALALLVDGERHDA